MKIIKHGGFVGRSRIVEFTCPYCGCVFQAKKGEYYVSASPINWRSYAQIDCPDCGNKLEKRIPLPPYTL